MLGRGEGRRCGGSDVLSTKSGKRRVWVWCTCWMVFEVFLVSPVREEWCYVGNTKKNKKGGEEDCQSELSSVWIVIRFWLLSVFMEHHRNAKMIGSIEIRAIQKKMAACIAYIKIHIYIYLY